MEDHRLPLLVEAPWNVHLDEIEGRHMDRHSIQDICGVAYGLDGEKVRTRREVRRGLEGTVHSVRGAYQHAADCDLPMDLVDRMNMDDPSVGHMEALDTSVVMAYFDGRLDTCLDGGR